jgi:hypothetical protein
MKLDDMINNCALDLKVTTCECVNPVAKDTLTRCPHCGESYYRENYMTSTCVYYPPIYKDGVNINPDRNAHTAHCTCMNCGKDFSVNK